MRVCDDSATHHMDSDEFESNRGSRAGSQKRKEQMTACVAARTGHVTVSSSIRSQGASLPCAASPDSHYAK